MNNAVHVNRFVIEAINDQEAATSLRSGIGSNFVGRSLSDATWKSSQSVAEVFTQCVPCDRLSLGDVPLPLLGKGVEFARIEFEIVVLHESCYTGCDDIVWSPVATSIHLLFHEFGDLRS